MTGVPGRTNRIERALVRLALGALILLGCAPSAGTDPKTPTPPRNPRALARDDGARPRRALRTEPSPCRRMGAPGRGRRGRDHRPGQRAPGPHGACQSLPGPTGDRQPPRVWRGRGWDQENRRMPAGVRPPSVRGRVPARGVRGVAGLDPASAVARLLYAGGSTEAGRPGRQEASTQRQEGPTQRREGAAQRQDAPSGNLRAAPRSRSQ